jgi:hypothetical protein
LAESEIPFVTVAGPNTTLWHYMSFSKLLQMLQSQSIWFSRVDQLIKADPYEGSLPFAVGNSRWGEEREAAIEKKHRMAKGSYSQMRDMQMRVFELERKRTFVSCWHSGATDNDAMWRLYGAEKDGSVCVKTTVSRMARTLPTGIRVGRVDYVNYDESWPGQSNIYVPFFRKRTCFQHENEVRFLFNSTMDQLDARMPGQEDPGCPIRFDPQDTFTNIFVSPTAPDWFRAVVETATLELGLDIPVNDAPMARLPLY